MCVVAVVVASCSNSVTARATSGERPGPATEDAPSALCLHLAAMTTILDGTLPDAEGFASLDEHVDAVIELAPTDVADALEAIRPQLQRRAGDPYDIDQMEAAAATVDEYAAIQCGKSVFDPRATPQQPIVPGVDEVPQTELPEAYLSDRMVMTTRAGSLQVRWEMPRTNLLDGPRPLRHIPAPAIGTFWVYGGPDVELRYDAMLLTNLSHLGTTDEAIASEALTSLNGPTPIRLTAGTGQTSRFMVDWVQPNGDRVYFGKAWSWEGNVFSLAVGAPWDREDLAQAAIDQLLTMTRTVRFEPL